MVKIFVTSQTEEYLIKTAMRSHRSFELSTECLLQDISLFVENKVNPLLQDVVLQQDVVQALVSSAKGM